MSRDDREDPDTAMPSGSEDQSFLVEVSPYPVAPEGAAPDVERDTGGRSARWLLVGGVVILGIVTAVLLVLANRPTGGVSASGVVSVTTLAPGGSGEPAEAGSESTPVPSIAADEPVVGAVPLEGEWAYTAVKTADLLAAPDFFSSDSIGASFSGVLVVRGDCTDGGCVFRSTYDLERTFLEPAEGGQPSPATWNAEGSSWFVELAAFAVHGAGDETCVVRVEETWKISLADLELGDDGWTASGFTGSLLRSTEAEPTLSTASTGDCGEWGVLDEWTVTGRALGAG